MVKKENEGSGKISRRDFMSLFPGLFSIETLISPEMNEPLAYGYSLDSNNNLQGDLLEIMGGDCYYSYLVKNGTKIKKVNMRDVQIVDKYPFVGGPVADPKIGIRIDAEWGMPLARLMGAGSVRIFGAIEHIGSIGSEFENAISAAEREGLEIIVVVNPTWPREDSFIRDQVASLVIHHPSVKIEWGNEPDNTEVIHWKDQDYNTFAHSFYVAMNTIRDIGQKTNVVVAALVDGNNTPKLVGALNDRLKDTGISLKDPNIGFAIHAYQSVWDVGNNINVVKRHLNRAGLRNKSLSLTEVGANYPGKQKWITISMVEQSLLQGVKPYIHQLLPDDEGFGIISPDISTFNPIFYGFQSRARRVKKQCSGAK